jgi:hypothetical protein
LLQIRLTTPLAGLAPKDKNINKPQKSNVSGRFMQLAVQHLVKHRVTAPFLA